MSEILPIIREKHTFFCLNSGKKCLKTAQTQGKTMVKLKYKTIVNPAFVLKQRKYLFLAALLFLDIYFSPEQSLVCYTIFTGGSVVGQIFLFGSLHNSAIRYQEFRISNSMLILTFMRITWQQHGSLFQLLYLIWILPGTYLTIANLVQLRILVCYISVVFQYLVRFLILHWIRYGHTIHPMI